ncbi:hypothetical protein V8C40DRAFT_286390 [Trichoderma camerunense]
MEEWGYKLAIHFGRIASIDTAIKSGEDRNRFAEAEGVIAFDTEGIWRWEGLPCLMVKSVSDYADGHKNTSWMKFTAETAASAIGALLDLYPRTDGNRDRHVKEIPRGLFLLPIQRNAHFTGREDILTRLLANIRPGAKRDRCYRAAITGYEGVGKTQIALEAAYRLHDKHANYSIFWASATDATTFHNDYRQIGRKMKIEGIDEDKADVKQLVTTALSQESRDGWLLVIDDVDFSGLWYLSGHLPSRNGSILFTLRYFVAAKSLGMMLGATRENIFLIEDLEIAETLSLTQTGKPKDVEEDSGYGSLQAPTIPSIPDPQNDVDATDTIVSPEKAEIEADMPVQSDDDIRSVVSDVDDIRSQMSDATTNEGMTGKALIRSFLAEQPQFKALCEKALDKMDRQRFVKNMSRLLKSFHILLTEEAESAAEKAVAGLLRSKRGRRRIGEQLAAHIDMEHEEAQEFDKGYLEIPHEKMADVENWISRAMRYSVAVVSELAVGQIQDQTQDKDGDGDKSKNRDQDQEEGQQQDSEEDSEEAQGEALGEAQGEIQDNDTMTIGFDDTNESYSFPHISELKKFLLASKAFQSLQMRFALMFLTAELGDVLQSIPKENIWLSQEQEVSISNQFKTLVENITKVKWNWWPLSQRKRILNSGESRLFWRCTCGVERWEEISREQREIVENILEWSNNHPPMASRCGVRKSRTTLLSSIKGILNYTNGGQITRPSRAATRYTPQESSSSSPPESVQLQPLAPAAVPLQQQQGPTIGQQAQATIPDSNNSLQWWILFGVRGARRTLVPTQIHVTSQTTDGHIFQELKRCYMIYRGRLRLWLSVWRLDYCEVVKFSRLTPDRMVREYRELPSDKDYHYDPRAGERDVRNPPISPHHFQTLFYACPSPCSWPFPHDCIPLVANTVNLARIPKRTREFEKDQSSPIWGFETVFAVSFSYVLVYHVVMVAGPFIFWGLWLKFHPDDLQNASVPITVVIGALSLFWSGAGILTSRERE